MKKITTEDIRALKEDDGLTLKGYKPISYRTGYQVAVEGKEARTPEEAFKYVKEYGGNCGLWYSGGVYYVDKSHRIKIKRDALNIGRLFNQISILKWSDMSLLYC